MLNHLNTNSLTFSNLKNYNNQESNNFSASLSVGSNPNNPISNGSLAISLAMQGSESSSDTRATIGLGNINIGGKSSEEILTDTNSTAEQLASANAINSLNRDITSVEQNRRDVITSDFDAELKIDTRLLAAVGNLAIGNKEAASANLDSYVGDVKKGVEIAFTSKETGLIGLSNSIKEQTTVKDENGFVIEEGRYPSLVPGLFLSESKTGKGSYLGSDGLYHESTEALPNERTDPLVNNSGLTQPVGLFYSYTDPQGNQKTVINQYDSNPALATLWQIVPGFKSFTEYHDFSVDKGTIPTDQKASSIPEYLFKNTVGAVGTLINPTFYKETFLNSSSLNQTNNLAVGGMNE